MIPRIKVSVLALVAMAAIGAVSAGAAQAGEFTAEKYPSTIKGTQLANHVFKFNTWSITCKVATFDGKLGLPMSELTLGAEYSQCETNSGKFAEVKMTTCDYVIYAGETLAEDKVDGTLDVKCAEATDGIDLIVPSNGCNVKLLPQNGLKTLTYTDNTAARDFDIDISLVEVKYQQGSSCPGGAMTAANGEYTGKSTMQAEAEGVVVGTTVD